MREIICPRLWQGHCSRLTKEYSNFIEWKATQSKQTPEPLSRHPSPAGLRCSPLLLSSRYSREMCISHTGVVQQGLPGRGFASGWTGRRTRGYINTHTAAACHILTAGCLGAVSLQLRARRAKSKTQPFSFCTTWTSGFLVFFLAKSFITHGFLKTSLSHLLGITIIIMNYYHSTVLLTCNYGDVEEGQRCSWQTSAFNKYWPDDQHPLITHCLFYMLLMSLTDKTLPSRQKNSTVIKMERKQRNTEWKRKNIFSFVNISLLH